MSNSTYTNTNRSPSLARGDHDTGLYDPARDDNRIVAVYETTERAVTARDLLVKAGVPSGDMQMLDQSQMPGTTPVGDVTDHSIWASIKSLFVPDEDAYGYAEGVRRGHAVLSVDPTNATDRHRVIEVLESTDPIDFDARLEEWRQAGYNNPYSQGVGAAEGMTTPAPARATDAAPAEPTASAAGSDMVPDAPAAPYPDGKRDGSAVGNRVRSYVAPRSDARTEGTGGQTVTSTTGATSSGMNAPRGS